MKIRSVWVIKVLGLVAACVIRLWVGTLRCRYRPRGKDRHPHRLPPEERYIYVFWHENLLLPACLYARQDCCALISKHADGQLIAEACKHLGFRTIRGSAGRQGGVEAAREILRLGQGGHHIGITPDGPRGPRRQAQAGAVYLASRTGLAIIPVGIGYHKPWRLRSWDRFAVPRPWSDAAVVTGEPIFVPPDLDREAMEQHRLRLELALADASADAERWAEHARGQAPLPPAPADPAPRQDVHHLLHGTHVNGNGRATDEHGPRAA